MGFLLMFGGSSYNDGTTPKYTPYLPTKPSPKNKPTTYQKNIPNTNPKHTHGLFFSKAPHSKINSQQINHHSKKQMLCCLPAKQIGNLTPKGYM
jgi:hypothetical protein